MRQPLRLCWPGATPRTPRRHVLARTGAAVNDNDPERLRGVDVRTGAALT